MKELVCVGRYQYLFMKKIISLCWLLGIFNDELVLIFFYWHIFKPGPTQDFVKIKVNELFICISGSKLLNLKNICSELLLITVISKSWCN